MNIIPHLLLARQLRIAARIPVTFCMSLSSQGWKWRRYTGDLPDVKRGDNADRHGRVRASKCYVQQRLRATLV